MYGRAMPNAPAQPSRDRTLPAVLAVALGAGLLCFGKTWAYDVWWHLATGRQVLEQRAIPWVDAFSHTYPGERLPHVEWLGDLIFYLAHSTAGLLGLTLLKVSCAVLVLVFLGLRTRHYTRDARFLLPALVTAGFMLQPRLVTDRPLVLSFVCLAATLWLLEHIRSAERPPWAALVVTSILPFAWVATHALSAIGPLFPAAFLADALVNRGRLKARWWWFAIPLAAAAGALALTATGRGIFHHAFLLEQGDAGLVINEWTQGSRHLGRQVLVGGALLVAATRWRQPRDLLILLAMVVLLTRGGRFSHVGVICAVPVVGWGLSQLARLATRGVGYAWLVVLTCFAVSWAGYRDVPLDIDFGVGLSDDAAYPVAALQAVRDFDLVGPIFNTWPEGSFLIFHAPEHPVFIDGRGMKLYSAEFVQAATGGIEDAPQSLYPLLDEHGIQFALVRSGPISDILSLNNAEWALVWADPTHQVFARSDGPNRAVVAEHGAAYLRLFSDASLRERWYGQLGGHAERCARLGQEMARAQAAWPAAPGLPELTAWHAGCADR